MVLPLAGVRVVELSQDVAGPYCGMALADMGAEVLKIERPGAEPSRSDPSWRAAKFVAYNRNKKSVSVDLGSDEGKMIVSRLLETADVFIENLAPGVVDGLGLSFETILKVNPRIIYCSIKSYLPGPYGERDVEDTVLESEAGYPQCTGKEEPEQPLTLGSPPLKLGVPVASFGAGEYAAVAVVGALLSRMKTGKGDCIRVGGFEAAVNLLAPSGYSLDKVKRKQPAENYRLKDGEWIQGSYQHIASSARVDRWKVFCEVFKVSREDYEATCTVEKRDALGEVGMRRIIAKYVSQFTLDEAGKMIVENNIIAGAVVTVREVLENEHLKSKLIPLVVAAEVGMTDRPTTVNHLMLPIRTEEYNPKATESWTPAPKLGQNTVETLQKLGYTEDQIKDLSRRGIIWPQL